VAKKAETIQRRRPGSVSQQLCRADSPLQARFSKIAEVWARLLRLVGGHCEIIGIFRRPDSAGRFAVLLIRATVCGPELLQELQRQCPKVRLAKIKFVVG
jgi:hypothetical protein